MKESEAKDKVCPHFHQAGIISATIARIFGENSPESIDKVMNITSRCVGSTCVMWESEYRAEDREDRQKVGPTYELKTPEGNGWHELHRTSNSDGSATIIWRRYVPTDCGDCGLKSKENECFASCRI